MLKTTQKSGRNFPRGKSVRVLRERQNLLSSNLKDSERKSKLICAASRSQLPPGDQIRFAKYPHIEKKTIRTNTSVPSSVTNATVFKNPATIVAIPMPKNATEVPSEAAF